jgi:hypothetical protein
MPSNHLKILYFFYFCRFEANANANNSALLAF